VSIPIWSTGPGAGIAVGGRQALAQGITALVDDHASGQEHLEFLGSACSTEITGQRHDAGRYVGVPHGDQGVEEGGCGQIGGSTRTDAGGKSGFGQPGDGCLGHHQEGDVDRTHRMTLRKSHVAMALPITEPDTLEVPAVRGR
jgi:hypothetical protein